MPITDASMFPTRGQPFRLPVYMETTAGAPLTTGWSSLSFSVSKDGSTVATGTGVAQIGGTNMGWIDLSASDMDSPLIQVSVTGTGARPFNASIYTVDLSDTPGVTLRLDRMIAWLFRRWRNRRRHVSGQIQVLRDGNSTDVFSAGLVSTNGQFTEGLEMS